MSQTPPPETQNQIQINILNDVTQTLIDSYKGYESCLNDFEERKNLRTRFSQRAKARALMITEFQNVVRDLGGDPETDGSVSGAAHRGWTKFTTLFQDDEKAACQSIDDGESFLAEKIRDVLRQPDITPRTRELLDKAYRSAKEAELFADILERSL